MNFSTLFGYPNVFTNEGAERFWRAVQKYAATRIKLMYMEREKWDCKCERCRSWASEVGGLAGVRVLDTVCHATTCKKCGHESYWDTRSGMVSTQIATLPPTDSLERERHVWKHLYGDSNGT